MHLDQSNLLELHVCLKITLVCHSFAQTGSLGQWLDRRAGSAGVITSFFVCFGVVVFGNDVYAALAYAIGDAKESTQSPIRHLYESVEHGEE